MSGSTIHGLALVAVIVSCACGNGEHTPDPGLAPIPDSQASLTVDVGTGSSEWVPLNDGDMVPIVAGPQGGFHVWTSIHVHDASVDTARINVTARIEATGEAAGNPSSVAAALSLTADGLREKVGMRDLIASPSAVTGKRVVLRVEAVTDDGRHGAGERVVVLE